MANTAISGLTASAADLAATDILPVVQTTGVGPVKMTGQQLAGGLLGSTTLSGATVTANAPVLDLEQTWNNSGVTFTGVKFNAAGSSSANSASGSLLMDLQIGGTSKFKVDKNGTIYTNTVWNASGSQISIVTAGSVSALFDASFVRTRGEVRIGELSDLILRRRNAANLNLGAADSATPVPQTLSVQGGSGTDIAGASFTIAGSQGTGTGAGGSIVFQVAPAGSSGTAQNALATALEITSARRLTVQPQGGLGGSFNASYGFIGASSGTGFDFDTIIGSAYACRGGAVSAVFLQNNQLGVGGTDTILARDAANTLALRNSTSPQTFRVYNTWANAGADYERGTIKWNSNVLEIGTEAGGSGALKPIKFIGATYVELVPSNVIAQNGFNESLKLHANYGVAWCPGGATDGASITTRLIQTTKSGSGVELSVGAYIAAPVLDVSGAKTVATLPTTPVTGQIARVTDGDSGLVAGNTVVNSGAGATPYLVWYNGTNWTVIGT